MVAVVAVVVVAVAAVALVSAERHGQLDHPKAAQKSPRERREQQPLFPRQ